MKFSLVFIYCLFSANSIFADDDMDAIWEKYKSMFQRSYKAEEEAEKRKNFELNHRMVQKHNAEADKGLHSYRLKINHLSDLSEDEIENYHSKCYFPHDLEKIIPFSDTASNITLSLPEYVDWREEGIVAPVKNQGHCNSCWAFASVGALESHLAKKTGKLVTLSEQNLVDCAWKYEGDGCYGGTLRAGFEYIMKNKGIDTEISYPYEAKIRKCRFTKQNVGGACKDYACIHRSEEYVKKVVATLGPVATSLYGSEKTFKHYGQGVYSSTGCDKQVDHGVIIVGYGEQEGEKYWIIKNSWSAHWGMNGYMYMKRDAPYMCGVAKVAAYPIL